MADNNIEYRVEKKVEGDDNWYYEGTWDSDEVDSLVKAVFNMGRYYSCMTDIRVVEVKRDE